MLSPGADRPKDSMIQTRSSLLLSAVLPIAASIAVLAFADVSPGVWTMHLVLLCVALLLVAAGRLLDGWMRRGVSAMLVVALTLIGIAIPLLDESTGPTRWIAFGPLNLYMAPVLLPSFLAASARLVRGRGTGELIALTASVCASVLLAFQPDASQVLALLVASTVLMPRYRASLPKTVPTMIILALVTAWALTRPDPPEPIPHVEGVFALALDRSLFAGVAVILSAVAFIACLCFVSKRGPAWLAAVAAYYSMLYVCSVAGLTPAPVIGFGAGPLLGFGLLVAVSQWIDMRPEPTISSSHSIQAQQ
jgi:cell division protein FtsW (lipid II flippase)